MDESEQVLRRYVLAKQEVASGLQAGRQAAEACGQAKIADAFRELQVRLAEDRFNLAVVGQFKRGKSSLMNAIIGRDLLPTGVLPLTSAITTLCYGPEPRVKLRRAGWSLTQEIALTELAEYVTEHGNPGNEKGVIEARVELPVPFLRRGLHFIDTPGVGSRQAANTRTTYDFLPQADAVIFVTSVEAPLSETEDAFLGDIREHVRRLFVVVNKMDLLAARERDEVLGYLQAGLAVRIGRGMRLHPVSARDALAAKLHIDAAALETSGLPAFEAELATFLSRERGQTYLVSIVDHAVCLFDQIQCGQETERSSSSYGSPSATSRQTLVALRERLVAGELGVENGAAPPDSTGSPRFDAELAASGVATSRRRVRSTDSAATCPVCAAQLQALLDFFVDTQYVIAGAEDKRQAFAESHGFCPVHMWQFQPLTSPQGLSMGAAPLIEATLAGLRASADRPVEEALTTLDALLSQPGGCPACRVSRNAEAEAVLRFLERIATPEGRQRYETSAGLCLVHLRSALASGKAGGSAAYLLQEQVRRLAELSEDMRGYVLKREAIRRGLTNSEEENAWRRAVVQLAGERGAYVPLADHHGGEPSPAGREQNGETR